MGSQNVPGSLGCNFVDSKFRIIFYKYQTNACIYVHEDVNSWARIIHKSHEHWSSNKQ